MIFPLAGLIIGALIGGFRARKRGGTGGDIAQWMAGHAIALCIIGLFIMLFIDRAMQ
ncbi:MAG: hypothetical protein JKX69_15645 [Rhodobacteraceae bacterium]|nr:hypothetical protein [Paracoccaceae bacterium]